MQPLLLPRVSLDTEHSRPYQLWNESATSMLYMSAMQRRDTACDGGAPLTSDL